MDPAVFQPFCCVSHVQKSSVIVHTQIFFLDLIIWTWYRPAPGQQWLQVGNWSESMQFKTCFELYGLFKSILQIFFLLRCNGLQLGPWQCQAITLRCLWAGSTWLLGNNQMADFGEKYSLYNLKQPREPHSTSYQLNFNLRTQYQSILWVNVKFSCHNSYLLQSYPNIS